MSKIGDNYVTMTLCFYCNQPAGLLLDRRFRDIPEELRNKVVNFEPCSTCAGYMKAGVILISCRATDDPEERKNPYRTGGWVAVTEEWVDRALTPETQAVVRKHRFAFVDDATWDLLGLPRPGQVTPAGEEQPDDSPPAGAHAGPA